MRGGRLAGSRFCSYGQAGACCVGWDSKRQVAALPSLSFAPRDGVVSATFDRTSISCDGSCDLNSSF